MEYIGTIATFTFQMVGTIFNWIMGSWVTAALPVGMVLLFIVNLIIASGSGSDDGNK